MHWCLIICAGTGNVLKVVYYSNIIPQIGQVAAAIHLNRLPPDQVPEIEWLIESFTGDEFTIGVPVRRGLDELGHEIFTIHWGKNWGLGLQTVGFLLSAHSNPLDWKFFNVWPSSNFSIRAGDMILHHLKSFKPAQYWVARGIQKQYGEIVTLVGKTKELSKTDG
jgi:hypothetical protein